jgi:hypothetical protein
METSVDGETRVPHPAVLASASAAIAETANLCMIFQVAKKTLITNGSEITVLLAMCQW